MKLFKVWVNVYQQISLSATYYREPVDYCTRPVVFTVEFYELFIARESTIALECKYFSRMINYGNHLKSKGVGITVMVTGETITRLENYWPSH